jgi:hypothetical protein
MRDRCVQAKKMKTVIKNIGLCISVALVLVSCSIFSPKVIPGDKIHLQQTDLDKFSGTYKLFPYLEIDENGSFPRKEKNAYTNLHNYIGEKTIEFDSTLNYSVNIQVLSQNRLLFIFQSDKEVLEQIEINGELKKDGLFYLDNNIRECDGIPYVLGRCYIRKGRVGLTKENDLLLNIARENFGGFLFLSSGRKINSTLIYKKMQ